MNPESNSHSTVSGLRVALLTNSLSPHSLPVCELINSHVKEFRAFLSEAVDTYHDFPEVQANFTITVQKSFNRFRVFRRAYGFWQTGEFHIPYDTYRQLISYRPDVILSVQLGIRTALAVLYRHRNPGVRLILWATLSQHTEKKRSWLRRAARRWIVRNIDGAFVNGKGGEEYLRQLGYAGPTFTVPYAIDDTLFRSDSYNPSPNVTRLFYAGQLVPQKGLLAFCEALERWCIAHPNRQIEFSLAGKGPEEESLIGAIQASNCKISILPKMPQVELAKHYKNSDIFAFPTLGDEWGVVVNESMSAGLPVLGSLFSQAVVELVEEGSCGWIFDPRDSKSIDVKLDCALMTEPSELRAMSKRAQDRILLLSPQVVASRALQGIETVHHRPRHPAQ